MDITDWPIYMGEAKVELTATIIKALGFRITAV